MAGLRKGLAVIEAFGPGVARVTVSEAAEATGITRAAARRCLLTLTELGYLVHDGKYFRPSPRMLRLGVAYLEADPLPTLAQPHLTAAREILNESVSLAVLEDGWAVFVARAEAQRIVSTGVRLGARLPAHCSATGRVLLAGLPEEQLRNYLDTCHPEPRTPKTPVEIAEIARIVERTRADGMAVTDEELDWGVRSLAVPVVDAKGRTLAAMSVSASTARVSVAEIREQFQPVLIEHAARLARML